MKKLLTLFLLTINLFGAVGDTTISIADNGWQAWLWIEGGATNGTYAFDFANATNNTLGGSEKLILRVTSPGYNAAGSTTTVSRVIYGTRRVRFPYPDNAFPDTEVVGGAVRVKVSLSDFVYGSDTPITADLEQGLYTFGGTPNNAGTGIAVTNSSTQPYPKVIANWTWPGWNQVGSTMRLRAVGFNAYARDGKPLAAMKFFAKDESGDIVSDTQTAMRVDYTLADNAHGLRFGEYYTDLDISSLTHTDQIRCDFAAYPWVGDSTAVFDTRNDTYSQPTYLPASITNLYVTTNYSAIAVVDLAGNDTNGKATNITDYAAVNSAHYFATINGAMAAIKGTNNTLFGHNDCGGAKVYVRTGIIQWLGASASTSGTPECWAEVIEYPGDTVSLTGDTGAADISDRVKVQGIEIAHASTTIPFSGIEALWFDQCNFNSSGSGPIQSCNVVYVTHSTVPQYAAGLKPFSTGNNAFPSILRGCDLSGLNSQGIWFTWVGNIRTNQNGTSFDLDSDKSTWGVPTPAYKILYNNYIGRVTNVLISADYHQTFGSFVGDSIVQNVFEHNAAGSFGLSASSTLNSTNVLLFHNNWDGARSQYFYNETGSTGAVKNLTFGKNNIHITMGEATDTDGTPNAGRTNAWSVRHRVGHSGNVIQQFTGVPTHGYHEFLGLHSYRPADGAFGNEDWIRYVDPQGNYRTTVGQRVGNYRLKTDSPAHQPDYRLEWILPFDIEGVPRGRFDPPGAYVAGNAKRGGFF